MKSLNPELILTKLLKEGNEALKSSAQVSLFHRGNEFSVVDSLAILSQEVYGSYGYKLCLQEAFEKAIEHLGIDVLRKIDGCEQTKNGFNEDALEIVEQLQASIRQEILAQRLRRLVSTTLENMDYHERKSLFRLIQERHQEGEFLNSTADYEYAEILDEILLEVIKGQNSIQSLLST